MLLVLPSAVYLLGISLLREGVGPPYSPFSKKPGTVYMLNNTVERIQCEDEDRMLRRVGRHVSLI